MLLCIISSRLDKCRNLVFVGMQCGSFKRFASEIYRACTDGLVVFLLNETLNDWKLSCVDEHYCHHMLKKKQGQSKS